MNIVKSIKGLWNKIFKKEELVNTSIDDEVYYSHLPDKVDLDKIPDVEVKCDGDEKYVLIMDDFIEQFMVYDLYINSYKNKDRINVVYCKNKLAGFIASKYITNAKRIDVALLDITMEYSMKLSDGTIVKYDGIDIAKEITDKFPLAKIIFTTIHTLDPTFPMNDYYIKKYKENTGRCLRDDNIFKNKIHKSLIDIIGIK